MNLHILYTPATGVGLHGGFRGNTWFKHRIKVFRDYTLKSLLNQESKTWVHWISFRPQEENHPYVKALREYLDQLPDYKYIMTFDGLMYHDDKFTDYNLKTKLRNFMMMELDCLNNKEWKNPIDLLKLAWDDKNKSLVQRVERSLKILKEKITKDYDWVYLTRIDSDDMFHKDALALIEAQPPEWKRSYVFDKGYILNIKTRQVADWNPPTNPPFHTIVFPGSTFFHAQSHVEYYGDFRSHEDATKVFNPITLDHDRYMVSYHGKHISTDWESPALKKVHHKLKYGSTSPFKGYMYTSGTGINISTHWQSRTRRVKNSMIGKEYENKEEILAQFGIR